jgi:hypothetical protein
MKVLFSLLLIWGVSGTTSFMGLCLDEIYDSYQMGGMMLLAYDFEGHDGDGNALVCPRDFYKSEAQNFKDLNIKEFPEIRGDYANYVPTFNSTILHYSRGCQLFEKGNNPFIVVSESELTDEVIEKINNFTSSGCLLFRIFIGIILSICVVVLCCIMCLLK